MSAEDSLHPVGQFLRLRSLRSPGMNSTQGVWVSSLNILRNLRVPLGITLRCLQHHIHNYVYTFQFSSTMLHTEPFRGSWTRIMMCGDFNIPQTHHVHNPYALAHYGAERTGSCSRYVEASTSSPLAPRNLINRLLGGLKASPTHYHLLWYN